jgi:hypothetical protein
MPEKKWQATAPMRAGLVSVCSTCFAYVLDRKAHRKWHEKQQPTRRQAKR